ncbi:unnamed protein product [Rotaria magnacalcarata]|uniref:Uncharacterized protein n=1 Tax=Rotaria magnacalcarata TaxID=392030 RepID=A0A8S2M9N4_9BILA|nr:unnamed protein product [Rotaria magnacalcarata]CAF4030100.1 unnamed protein product [Rotaria magnacalcarata]CAF4369882.1 unnamed protein product [Rotaria magnacalcarata]
MNFISFFDTRIRRHALSLRIRCRQENLSSLFRRPLFVESFGNKTASIALIFQLANQKMFQVIPLVPLMKWINWLKGLMELADIKTSKWTIYTKYHQTYKQDMQAYKHNGIKLFFCRPMNNSEKVKFQWPIAYLPPLGYAAGQ